MEQSKSIYTKDNHNIGASFEIMKIEGHKMYIRQVGTEKITEADIIRLPGDQLKVGMIFQVTGLTGDKPQDLSEVN